MTKNSNWGKYGPKIPKSGPFFQKSCFVTFFDLLQTSLMQKNQRNPMIGSPGKLRTDERTNGHGQTDDQPPKLGGSKKLFLECYDHHQNQPDMILTIIINRKFQTQISRKRRPLSTCESSHWKEEAKIQNPGNF